MARTDRGQDNLGAGRRRGGKTKNELVLAAQHFCPPQRSMSVHGHNLVATGQLLESIFGDVYQVGPEQIGFGFGARAPQAKYVLKGTGAQGMRYIYSTQGWANKGVIDSWYRKGDRSSGRTRGVGWRWAGCRRVRVARSRSCTG